MTLMFEVTTAKALIRSLWSHFKRERDGELMAVYLQGNNNRVMTGVDLYGTQCLHNNLQNKGLQSVHGISKLFAIFFS